MLGTQHPWGFPRCGSCGLSDLEWMTFLAWASVPLS